MITAVPLIILRRAFFRANRSIFTRTAVGILPRLTKLLRAEFRWLVRRIDAIIAGIMLSNEVHDFATRWMGDTVHVTRMRVTSVPGVALLLVTNQLVVSVVRLSQPIAVYGSNYEISWAAQVVRWTLRRCLI